MKDRLTEIVKPFVSGSACEHESGSCELTDCRSCNARSLADHLLADGWIRPPMKLGQICFKLCDYLNEVDECRVSSITQKADGTFKIRLTNLRGKWCFEITADNIGKTVFLTREQAERALAERSEK